MPGCNLKLDYNNFFWKFKTTYSNLINLEQIYFIQTTYYIIDIQYYALQLNLQVHDFTYLIT